MISDATLDQLARLGEEIKRDKAVVSQRSVDICWHWWNVGKILVAAGIKDTRTTIPADTSIKICEALGLSTKLSKSKNRPHGEISVKRAIDTYTRYPDEEAAKEAIEAAGTYHKLMLGSSYESRLAKSMTVPTALLDRIARETGIRDREARRYIAMYLRLDDIQDDVTEFIKQQEHATPASKTS